MITKDYIKQCEQAKQLQKKWKPKVGDYVWRKYNFFGEEIDSQIWSKDNMEEIIILTYASDIDGYFSATKDGETRIFNSHNEAHKKTCIWLPTQEQLQEMIKTDPWHNLLADFFFWHLYVDVFKIDSYNELWLAFVMKEKYNKIWTGEKWEAIK